VLNITLCIWDEQSQTFEGDVPNLLKLFPVTNTRCNINKKSDIQSATTVSLDNFATDSLFHIIGL
jgi:hypothetical protein